MATNMVAPMVANPAVSTLAGIGIDLIYLNRINRALTRFGERFAAKILGADELPVFQRRSARDAQRGVRYLATRFAAKEAFSKAIGLGMHAPMWWTRAQVLNAASGQPVMVLSEPLRSWYAVRFGAVHVSLTDERDLAAAYVVVERRSETHPPPCVTNQPADGVLSGSPQGLPPGPVVVDIAGTALTPQEVARLRHPLVGGVVLFTRNFENRAQLTDLCAAIHACRDEPLLITVDHEGGRVQRFRGGGFTTLPAMRRLGELWQTDRQHALRRATETGYVLAAELRACGVDLSFTPVMDLDYGASHVIGDRALHRDPQVVAQLARALIQGLQRGGLAACGKHFPGHGFVEADSHHDLPVDNRDLDTLLREDAAPYGWLGDLALPAVMPAHVVYNAVDSLPAGFSPFWIQTVLRGQLGYDGLIFSDDLTMQGASIAGDITARARAALAAGCDMVLVCNRPDLADELLARLSAQTQTVAQTAGQTDPAARQNRLPRLAGLIPRDAATDWGTLQADPRYQRARAAVAGLGDTLSG